MDVASYIPTCLLQLGHIVCKSKDVTRGGKVLEAASAMGGTVLAGGITTLGAAVIMFACQLTFFSKMAVLMVGTILASLAFSLLFFLPLCAVIGPTGQPSGWSWKRKRNKEQEAPKTLSDP